MRLYLSSYRLGCATKELLELMGTGRNAVIIGNALDHIALQARTDYEKNVYSPKKDLSSLGITATELDLRDYFKKNDALKEELEKYHLVWILGGNVFLLRRAMRLSGFDQIITKMLHEDTIVYGGFSAAAVVVGSSLKGFEMMDDPLQISQEYSSEIIWDGLNLISVSIIPHIASEHPETKLANKTMEYLKQHCCPIQPLMDGDVFVFNRKSDKEMKGILYKSELT